MYMHIALLAAYLAALQTDQVHGARTFIRSVIHDDHRCPGSFDFGTSSNALECMSECERIPTCNSISYSGLTKSCLGNFVVITQQAMCPAISGWLYYKDVDDVLGLPCTSDSDCPLQYSACINYTCLCDVNYEPAGPAQCIPTSTYMFPCTANTECLDDFTECWDGYCKCVPGYSYKALSNVCVDICSTYGSTYEKYIDYDLICASSDDLHSGLSIGECLNLCTANPTCLSMSYHNGLGACQVRYCDPITNNPTSFSPFMEVDTYVRNCA